MKFLCKSSHRITLSIPYIRLQRACNILTQQPFSLPVVSGASLTVYPLKLRTIPPATQPSNRPAHSSPIPHILYSNGRLSNLRAPEPTAKTDAKRQRHPWHIVRSSRQQHLRVGSHAHDLGRLQILWRYGRAHKILRTQISYGSPEEQC